jgi:hypothetical protein
MDPINDFRSLHRLVGSAILLLALFAAYAPADWTGDVPVYVAGGNVISDGELTERLHIALGTLATYRRRLRRAHLLDWLLRPGVGRVYIIGALDQAWSREQAAIQRVAKSQAVQTGWRSTQSNTPGFIN